MYGPRRRGCTSCQADEPRQVAAATRRTATTATAGSRRARTPTTGTSTAAPAQVCHHTATQVIAATATTVASPGGWRQRDGISSYADVVQATVRQRPVPGGPRQYRTR